MIRHYQVFLFAIPVLLGQADAAPLEIVELTPKTEKGDIRGAVSNGNTQSYRLKTGRRSIDSTDKRSVPSGYSKSPRDKFSQASDRVPSQIQ